MFEFHQDRKRYFDIQVENTIEYVIPFIEVKFPLKPGTRVLEIGCGEGGVLKAFIDKGCTGVGVELDEPRLVYANDWLKDEIASGKARFVSRDIYKTDAEKDLGGSFDLIILKDVIEHIHDQKKLISWMRSLLNPGGVVFFGFPPWQMPFGGHQQICKNRILSKLPYYHLLPAPVYRWIMKVNKENVEEMMEIKETGISIERFEKIVHETGYVVRHKTHYLFNPIYKYKFGVNARKQFPFIQGIPYIRNFFTTCVYYLIQ